MSCINSNCVSSCSPGKVVLLLAGCCAITALVLYVLPSIARVSPHSSYFALASGIGALGFLATFAIYSCCCQKEAPPQSPTGNPPPIGDPFKDTDQDQKREIFQPEVSEKKDTLLSLLEKKDEQKIDPSNQKTKVEVSQNQPVVVEKKIKTSREYFLVPPKLELPIPSMTLPPLIKGSLESFKQTEEKEELLHYLDQLNTWISGLFAPSPFADPNLDLSHLSPTLKKIHSCLSGLQGSWTALYLSLKDSIQFAHSKETRQPLIITLEELLSPPTANERRFCLLQIPALIEGARQELLHGTEITCPFVQQLLALNSWIWEGQDLWLSFLKNLNTRSEGLQKYMVQITADMLDLQMLSLYLNLCFLPALKKEINHYVKVDFIPEEVLHKVVISDSAEPIEGDVSDLEEQLPQELSPFYKFILNLQKTSSSPATSTWSVIDQKQLCYTYQLQHPPYHTEDIELRWSADSSDLCTLTIRCQHFTPVSPDFWEQWSGYLSFMALEGRIPPLKFSPQGIDSTELSFHCVVNLQDAALMKTLLEEMRSLLYCIGVTPCSPDKYRIRDIGDRIFSHETPNWHLLPEIFWCPNGFIAGYLQTDWGRSACKSLSFYGRALCLITLEKQWLHLEYLQQRANQLGISLSNPQPDWLIELQKNIAKGKANFSNVYDQLRRACRFNPETVKRNDAGKTEFLKAVEENRFEDAQAELEKGASVDAQDFQSQRAISYVLKNKNQKMLDLLLHYQVDLWTPLGKEQYPIILEAIDNHTPDEAGRTRMQSLLEGGVALDVSYEGKSLDEHLIFYAQNTNDLWLPRYIRQFRERQKKAQLTPEELIFFKLSNHISSDETPVKYRISYKDMPKKDQDPKTVAFIFQTENDEKREKKFKGLSANQALNSPEFRIFSLEIDAEKGTLLKSSGNNGVQLPPDSPTLPPKLIFPLCSAFKKHCRTHSYSTVRSSPSSDCFIFRTPRAGFQRNARDHLTKVFCNIWKRDEAKKVGAKSYNIEYMETSGRVTSEPLSNLFLSQLIAGLTADPFLNFCSIPSSALLMPVTEAPYVPTQPLPRLRLRNNEDGTYYQLGALFAFCLTASPRNQNPYFIGKHFDEALFAAICSLTGPEIAAFSPSSGKLITPLTQLKIVTALLTAYGAFESLKAQIALLTQLWSKEAQGMVLTEEETQQALQAAQAIFGYEIEDFDSSEKIKVACLLAPLEQIIVGMYDYCSPTDAEQRDAIWEEWTTEQSYEELSEKIQGTFNRKRISRCFVLDDPQSTSLQLKLRWLKEWIEDPHTSDQEIRAFLLAVTGSRSLEYNQTIKLRLQKGTSYTPLPIADTVSYALEVAPSPCRLGSFYDGTKNTFLVAMRYAFRIKTAQESPINRAPKQKQKPIVFRLPVKSIPLDRSLRNIWDHLQKTDNQVEALNYLEQLKSALTPLLSTSLFNEAKLAGKELSSYLLQIEAKCESLVRRWQKRYEQLKRQIATHPTKVSWEKPLTQLKELLLGPCNDEDLFCLLQLPNLIKRAGEVLDSQEGLTSAYLHPLLALNSLIWKDTEREIWIKFLKSFDKHSSSSLHKRLLTTINEAIEKQILEPYLNLVVLKQLKKNPEGVIPWKEDLDRALLTWQGISDYSSAKGKIYQIISAFYNLLLPEGGQLEQDTLFLRNTGEELVYACTYKMGISQFSFEVAFHRQDLRDCTFSMNCQRLQPPKFFFSDWKKYFQFLAERGLFSKDKFHVSVSSTSSLTLSDTFAIRNPQHLQWITEELTQFFKTLESDRCMGGMHRFAEIGAEIFSKKTFDKDLCLGSFWRPNGVIASYLQTSEGAKASYAFCYYGTELSPAIREKEYNQIENLLEEVQQIMEELQPNPLPDYLDTLQTNLKTGQKHFSTTPTIYRFDEAVLSRDIMGKTAFLRAVENEDLDTARDYLKKGAYVDSQDKKGNNALSIAIEKQNLELLKLLIEYGVDLSARLGQKSYPVAFLAIDYYTGTRRQFMEYLLSAGIALHVSDQGKTLDIHLNDKGDPWLTEICNRFRSKQRDALLTQKEMAYFKEYNGKPIKIQAGAVHYYLWFEKEEKKNEEPIWLLFLQTVADWNKENDYLQYKGEGLKRHQLSVFVLNVNAQGKLLSSSHAGIPTRPDAPLIFGHLIIPIYLGFLNHCRHRAHTSFGKTVDHPDQDVHRFSITPFRIKELALDYMEKMRLVLYQVIQENENLLEVRYSTFSNGRLQGYPVCTSDFLSLLIEGLIASPQLRFTSFSPEFSPSLDGFPLPITNAHPRIDQLIPSLNEDETRAYYNLGILFAFCLTSSSLNKSEPWETHFPVGHHFDPGLIEALFKFTSEDLVKSFSELDQGIFFNMIKNLLDAYGIYDYEETLEKFEACYEEQKKRPLTEPEEKEMKQLFTNLVRIRLGKNATLGQCLAPLHAIAQGIYVGSGSESTRKETWKHWTNHQPNELNEAMQGPRLERTKIVNSLVIDQEGPSEALLHLEQKRAYLEKWIAEVASAQELRAFLRFVTGSPKFSPAQKITLSLQKENLSPLPQADSSSGTLYFAPSPIWSGAFYDGTFTAFAKCLRARIKSN